MMIELRERSESLIQDAQIWGFDRKEAIEVALYGVDKIINYGNVDRIEESYWYDVMEYLESIQLNK